MPVSRGELEALPRWARVALVARTAMRLAPYFRPGAMRSPQAAKADYENVEVCGLLAALASVHGRQLDSGLAHTAVQAALTGIGAPNRVPLTPEDYAMRMAALAVQMSANSSVADDIDDPCARSDYEVLTRCGLAGDQQAVPREFFNQPLWSTPPNWEPVWSGWKAALDEHGLSRIHVRYIATGFDWEEAQRRAEEWARENVKTFHSVQADIAGTPEAIALELKAHADALVAVIDAGPDPATRAPMVVAIEGPQGSGKAIVGRMLQRRLEAKPAAGSEMPHRTCWFNAWRHEEADTLVADLVADIVRACDRHRPAWKRFFQPLPWDLLPAAERRLRVWGVVLVATMLLVPSLVGILLLRFRAGWAAVIFDIFDRTVGANFAAIVLVLLGVPAVLVLAAHYFGMTRPAVPGVARFFQDPQGPRDQMQGEVAQLLQETVPPGCRMVVFFEDLERCLPARAIDLLNSLGELLAFPELIFVVLGDRNGIARGNPAARLAGLQPLVRVALQLPEQKVRTDPEAPEGPEPPKMEEAFVIAFSRTLRGQLTFGQVYRRSLQVKPRWLSPYVLLGWTAFALPAAVYMFAENLAWPPACPRRFTNPGAFSRIVRWLLVLAVLGSFAFGIIQSIGAWFNALSWTVLTPGAGMRTQRAYSWWQFVNVALMALLGFGYGWWGRRQEQAALVRGRSRVASRLATITGALPRPGAAEPLDWAAVATQLRGCTGLAPSAEQILVQEAIGLRKLKYN